MSESMTRESKLAKLSREAVGLDVEYTLATGERTRRVYLDSTASTLELKVVRDTLRRYRPYYSNTHSVAHFSAKRMACGLMNVYREALRGEKPGRPAP